MFPARRTWLFAALVTQVAIVQDVRADRGQAVVVGLVRDAKTDLPVAGVLVVATSPKMQGEATVITDARGLYLLPNLPPGVYELQFSAANYEQTNRSTVTLTPDQRIRVDAHLRLASEDEELRVVVVPAPTVDIGSTALHHHLDEEFIKRVPIAQPGGRGAANRSFEAIAEATPAAANDAFGTSFAGSTSPENNYMIDGMNVGNSGYGLNGTPLTSEFLQSIDVMTGGYMPEYGRSTGGVIDAITKSGSNEFHGGAWMFYTPGQLEGRRRTVLEDGTAVVTRDPLDWIGDIGVDLGGPILKDRVWFYVGFSAARTVYSIRRSFWRRVVDPVTGEIADGASPGTELLEPIPGTEEERKAQSTQFQAIVKLDVRASNQHRLSLTGIVAPTLTGGHGTYAIDPELGGPEVGRAIGRYGAIGSSQDGISGDVIARWNATSRNRAWLFDTLIGYHHQRQTRLPVDGSRIGGREGLAGRAQTIWQRTAPEHSITEFETLSPSASAACADVQDVVTCPVQEYFTGGSGFIFDRRFGRARGRHGVTFFGRAAGHHEVKFGIDLEYLSYRSHRAYSGQRTLQESTDGLTFYDLYQYGLLTGPDQPLILDELDYTTRTVIFGAYIQDSWSIVDRVTLNVGVRYDAQWVYGANHELVIVLPRQFSPRVGAVWDPTNAGRSRIFFSYGRFFQTVPLDVADRAGSGESEVAAEWWSEDAVGPTGCNPLTEEEESGDCRNDDNRVAFNTQAAPDQYYQFYSAGKTPVDPDLKAQSQDELIAGGELEVFEGARVSLSYERRWIVRAIEDMSRDEGTTFFIGNPGEGIASDFPQARRQYDAIILEFHKDFRGKWLVSASYVASWLRGNFSGLFRPETLQLNPFITSDFDLVSLLENRDGYLRADARHAVKGFAAGEVRLGRHHAILLGGVFRATSGGPTDYLGSHYIYGSDEVYILPRGSGKRLPWVFTIDTNVGYRYDFNEDLSLSATLDVFNLINFQTATARDDRYTVEEVLSVPNGNEASLSTLTNTDGIPVTPNPNFGNDTAYQSPRQFRFGLRLSF